MPYNKDLRDLLKATQAVSRTIAEGIEREKQKIEKIRLPSVSEKASASPE